MPRHSKTANQSILTNFSDPHDILMNAPIGIFTSTPEGRFLSANLALAEMLGYDSPEELIESVTDIAAQIYADPSDREEIMRLLREKDEVFNYECRALRRDGSIIWTSRNARAVLDWEGNVVHYQGFVTDITKRKRAEDALLEREQRIYEINECLLSLGPDFNENIDKLTALCGRILGATCALYNRLEGGLLCSRGLWQTPPDYDPKDKPEGHICYDVIQKGSNSPVVVTNLQATAYAKTDPNVTRYELKTYIGQAVKQGDSYVGSICAVFQIDTLPSEDDQRVLSIISSALGAEENRRQAAEDLFLERHRLSVIIQETNVGTWEWNVQTGETIFNERWCEIIGYTLEELSPVSIETWRKYAHPEDLKKCEELLHRHFIREIDCYECECRMKHKEGHWVWVMDRGEVVSWTGGGKPMMVMGTHQDITELQRALQERIAKEAAERASRLKSEFLASMSHEIRNPLTVIMGLVQIMENDLDLRQAKIKDIKTIMRNGKHLLRLINDILDISEIEAGKSVLRPVDFNLPDLLEELTALFKYKAGSKGLELILEMDRNLPREVHADSRKLRQIIINLLDNAIKFTVSGRVALRAGAESAAMYEKNSPVHLVVEVEDTGPGISDPDLEGLFNPFHQTAGTAEHRGTGLGLAISQRYAGLMGGDISISTLKDQGSCFRLQVPARIVQLEDGPGEIKPRIAGLEPGSGPWRILIVDNEPDILALLKTLLQPVGFQVREAVNGLEAVKVFKEWSPHAVLMDLRMPVMGGLEATGHIRNCRSGRDVFVLAITAWAFNGVQDDYQKFGVDSFLYKPFDKDELFRLLEQGLGLKYVYKT